MDWSNIDGSTEDIVLGESGNPYSPYFRDQWDDYYNGTNLCPALHPRSRAAQRASHPASLAMKDQGTEIRQGIAMDKLVPQVSL